MFHRVAEARHPHGKVRQAVLRGDIPPPQLFACSDCGRQASQYDHRDYTKPLKVEPVCPSCNQKRGQAYPYLYRPNATDHPHRAICSAALDGAPLHPHRIQHELRPWRIAHANKSLIKHAVRRGVIECPA